MDLHGRIYPQVMTCVYRLYDDARRLLYVGVAYDFDIRFKQHAKGKDWWPLVAHRDVIWFDNRLDAMYEEARAIENEGPIHNRRQGIHPVGLIVIQRRRRDPRRHYPAEGVLLANSYDKELVLRDVARGDAHAVVAVEGDPLGVAIPLDWYLAARNALGEGLPDTAAMPRVEVDDWV